MNVREMLDVLGDPRAPETYSAAAGEPLLTVDVPDAASAAGLAMIVDPSRSVTDLRALPCVVVLVVPDPAVFAGAGHVPLMLGDVLLTEAPDAPRPYVTGSVDALREAVASNPLAATAFALLLRSSEGLDVPAGLVAESATYATLRAGAEFAHRRAAHPPRPATDTGAARVGVDREGDVVRVTMTRAARGNALDPAMRDALADAFAAVAADPTVSLEFHGDGPDFCTGEDPDDPGGPPDPAVAHLTRLTRSPARLLHSFTRRTSAYLHGACLDGGVGLPAFAGRVVAAPDTSIGLPGVSHGLVPGSGATVGPARRIGRQRTAWIGLSGCRVDAAEALRWGLVDEIG